MNNITMFNCYAARIMAHLYDSFPVKQYFDISAFVGKCELKEFSEDLDHKQIACSTVIFLKENGFIEYSQGSTTLCYFSGVTLTTKGLSVLAQPMPEAIIGQETLGDTLSKVAKQAGSKAVTDILTSTMVQSIRMFGMGGGAG